MSIHHARIAASVALALSSCGVLAGNFTQEYQKGFYVGVNTGASFVTGQTYAKVSNRRHDDNDVDHTLTFRDEASARGYNGGLTLGWSFYCDREYIYSVELSGNLYSNRAYQNIWGEFNRDRRDRQEGGRRDREEAFNFEQSWDMTYSGELVFKPGYFVSDSTQLFAILGGSIAQVKSKVKDLSDEGRRHHDNDVRQEGRRHHNSNELSNSDTLYGFVLGAGISKQLCNRLSVFTSYEYTYYGHNDFDDNNHHHHGHEGVRQEHGHDNNLRDLSDRKLRIDTNVFKVGLAYTF